MIYSIPDELRRANDTFVCWRYLVLDKNRRQIKRTRQCHPFYINSKASSGKQSNADGNGPKATGICADAERTQCEKNSTETTSSLINVERAMKQVVKEAETVTTKEVVQEATQLPITEENCESA